MMDSRMSRFNYCDRNMFPFIEEVLARLPEGMREDILGDNGFQVATVENFGEFCIVHYRFDYPVKYLSCVDAKIFNKPKYMIIYTIAHELASYIVNKEKSLFDEKKAQQLLIKWGFEKEIEAVRDELTMTESDSYKTGYAWAKKQNKDYLFQHFGLYFNEWNEKGLRKTSKERSQILYHQPESSSTLSDKKESESQEYHDLDKNGFDETLEMDEKMFAGIMTAMKEIELRI